MAHYGKVFQMVRQKLGLTQKELGEKMGISRGSIGHIESGERDPFVREINYLYHQYGIDPRLFFLPEEKINGQPLMTDSERIKDELLDMLNNNEKIQRASTHIQKYINDLLIAVTKSL